jgi:protein-disulfide isomerase
MTTGQESGLTRKQRREQARVERRAAEVAERARTARRKRFLWGSGGAGIGATALIAVLASMGAFSTSTNVTVPPSHGLASGTAAKHIYFNAVRELYNPPQQVPAEGSQLGFSKAAVTLQVFGDLESRRSREFVLAVLPTLIRKYVPTEELRIEYKAFESSSPAPEIFDMQQEAALAAGKQQAGLWWFIDLLYHEQGREGTEYMTWPYLLAIAKQVPGLNLRTWSRAVVHKEFGAQLKEDAKVHREYKLDGTPAFLIGKTEGNMQVFKPASVTDPAAFESAIEETAKS